MTAEKHKQIQSFHSFYQGFSMPIMNICICCPVLQSPTRSNSHPPLWSLHTTLPFLTTHRPIQSCPLLTLYHMTQSGFSAQHSPLHDTLFLCCDIIIAYGPTLPPKMYVPWQLGASLVYQCISSAWNNPIHWMCSINICLEMGRWGGYRLFHLASFLTTFKKRG